MYPWLVLSYNKIMVSFIRINLVFALLVAFVAPAHAFLTEDQIAGRQKEMASMDLGARIAGWAEAFIGTPYDPDPLGAYVTLKSIVADKSADCMYLTFRSVELAATTTPADAVQAALDKRFLTRGKLAPDGTVLNYDERFQYAMDMISSNKWGSDITAALVPASIIAEVPGSRGYGLVSIIPADAVLLALPGMQSGDIVFFVKKPSRRVVGEIIGHIGIVKREAEEVYLIHASGRKNSQGKPSGIVVKVPFAAYALDMPFKGVLITRLSEKPSRQPAQSVKIKQPN